MCIKNLAQNAGDSIELIQTSGKFMLEVSLKCWSLQPKECEFAALIVHHVVYSSNKLPATIPGYYLPSVS